MCNVHSVTYFYFTDRIARGRGHVEVCEAHFNINITVKIVHFIILYCTKARLFSECILTLC